MHHHRAANRYRTISLQSASPQQVLGEVFHRLTADINEAKRTILARDIAAKSRVIAHALDLVDALDASLEHETAPEMCANLSRLYDYVRSRLLDASARLDIAPLGDAERVVGQLSEAFREAVASK